MIFERSLQRELAYTAGAVFMVLLTLVLTTMMIRIVGFAASGQIDPRDVLVLIGLTVIGYMAVMLIVIRLSGGLPWGSGVKGILVGGACWTGVAVGLTWRVLRGGPRRLNGAPDS